MPAPWRTSRQHLVGDHPEREEIGFRRGPRAHEIFRRRVLDGAENFAALRARLVLGDAGDAHGAEIDDLYRSRGVDDDVLGAQPRRRATHVRVHGSVARRPLANYRMRAGSPLKR